MNLKKLLKELVSESIIYGFVGVISRFISFFTVPIFTNFLTPANYGVLNVVNSMIALVGLIVFLGLDVAYARWFYDSKNENDNKISFNSSIFFPIVVGLVSGLLIILFSSNISIFLTNNISNSFFIKIGGLNIALNILIQFCSQLFRLKRKPIKYLIFHLTNVLLNVGLSLLFIVKMELGLKGMFMSLGISTLIIFLVSTVFLFKEFDLGLFQFTRTKKMLNFSLPLIPGNISFWLINSSASFFLIKLSTSHDAGIFSIANALAYIAGLVYFSFDKAWPPFAFSVYKEDNSSNLFAKIAELYCYLMVLICCFVALFSKDILILITTEAFHEAHWSATIISFNFIFIGLTSIFALGIELAKKTMEFGKALFVGAIITFLLNLFLIPYFGNIGASMSLIISQAFIPIYIFKKSQKVYFIPYKSRKILLFLIASITFIISVKFVCEETKAPIFIKIVIFAFFGTVLVVTNLKDLKKLLIKT